MIFIYEYGDMSDISLFCFASDTIHKVYRTCELCKGLVYSHYSFIIEKLREAGLLPKDYKRLCCKCYNIVK